MNIDQSKRKRGRFWLICLVALFVVPMLGSWWLFFHTQKTGKVWGTSNKGSLIQPMIALKDINLPLQTDNTLSLKEIERHWTLVYLMPKECAAQCEKDIFHMRQIHVSISKDFDRVQRLLVLQNPAQRQEKNEFLQHYDDMMIALSDDENQPLRKQIILPNTEEFTAGVNGHIILVDPQANAMMVYEKGVDPAKVFKDLKKLLRMSRIG